MKVKEFKQGVELEGYITGMPDEYYHSTEGFISKSSLSALKASPFRFFKGVKFKQTKAMQIGTAIHCALLEPDKFEQTYKVMPELTDKRLKSYKDAKTEFVDYELITGQDAKNINGMMDAVLANDAAKELLQSAGWCEVSGFHTDPDTGIKLRHRFDKLTDDGCGVDIKKTQSVHPDELSKTIHKYGYEMQDALYSDGYEAITGRKLNQFYFIFVEESYPHEVAVVYLDDISKQVGRDQYKALLTDYDHYKQNPHKVNNNSEINMISLPEWALREYENTLEDGGIF
jgi:hypothetical protein